MNNRDDILTYLQQLPIEGGVKKIREGYNFKCPVCGDSKKSKSKRRGFLLVDDKKSVFVCHNEHCEEHLQSKTLYGLLYHFNPALANEFLNSVRKANIDKIKQKAGKKQVSVFDTIKKKSTSKKIDTELDDIDELEEQVKNKPKPLFELFPNGKDFMYIGLEENPIELERNLPEVALEYLKSRHVKYDNESMFWSPDQGAIVFMFKDIYNNPYGYQRRSVTEKRFKIALHEEANMPKAYGLQNLNKNTLRVYIFESIFNSLSVEMGDNEVAISILGTHLSKDVYDMIVEVSPNAEFIFCLDNDKAGREKIIQMTVNNAKNSFMKTMQKWNEFKYFLYPSWWKEEIDINDARKIMTSKQIKDIIVENLHSRIKTFIKLKRYEQ